MSLPLSGKRIGLLAGWASRKNGGVFEALVAHVDMLQSLGAEPHVFAAADGFSDQDGHRLMGAVTHYKTARGSASLAYAPGLLQAMRDARLDCLHSHGIWQGHSRLGALWARENHGRYVISPHGMLDPWIVRRSRIKKGLFRLFVESANWRIASVFHALTEAEAEDIRRTVPAAEIAVIPNAAPTEALVGAQRSNEVVYVGRIHEKKNLRSLVDGWRLAEPKLPSDARLTIAGIGDAADISALQTAIAASGVRAEFVGPAYGEAKCDLLSRSRYLVLPSLSEGLPMAILDSWATATPTLMSAACHLPQGFETGAALDSGTTPESIATSLAAAFSLSTENWQAMSDAALTLARGPFSAQVVAQRWESLYARVMQGGTRHG